MFLVVEHFEKYLTGYIIRIIANHTKLVRKQLAEIQTQKVFGQNLAFQDGKVLFQISPISILLYRYQRSKQPNASGRIILRNVRRIALKSIIRR